MIELTTGIVLLLASLSANGANGAIPAESATTTKTSSSTAITATTTIGRELDAKMIEKYLRKELADTPILIDIARCESTFMQYHKNGEVVRGRVDNADVGVMQINERYHLETAVKLGYDIHTVEGNVAYAKYLYENQGAAPWLASSKCWSKISNQIAKK